MAESRMIEVAEELLSRSREGKVEWAVWGTTGYLVKFPDIQLSIRLLVGAYALSVHNAKGELADQLVGDPSDTRTYRILRDIYELARRRAIEAEGTIDKALDYLKASA